MRGEWRRVTRRQPCPICGKPDWCLIRRDGEAAICPRVQSGSKREIPESGYLHELTPGEHDVPPAPMVREPERSPSEIVEMMERYRSAVDGTMLTLLAAMLRVNRKGLAQMGVGWDAERDAIAFPMVNHCGELVGIRLRLSSGKKIAVRGSHNGLFCGPLRRSNSLAVVEGATDTAAMLGLGIVCVGRPSCSGGTALLLKLCERLGVRRVSIIADRDEPGRRGAERLRIELELIGVLALVLEPPDVLCKDVREWVSRGATRAVVTRWLNKAWTDALRGEQTEAV